MQFIGPIKGKSVIANNGGRVGRNDPNVVFAQPVTLITGRLSGLPLASTASGTGSGYEINAPRPGPSDQACCLPPPHLPSPSYL